MELVDNCCIYWKINYAVLELYNNYPWHKLNDKIAGMMTANRVFQELEQNGTVDFKQTEPEFY